MWMILVVFLILVFAFYLPYDYGAFEGRTDAKKIHDNGSEDSLKDKFHAWNLIERTIVCALISGLIVYGLHYAAGFSLWFAVPYLFYFPAAFGWRFTQVANLARGLHPWYVSHDDDAARFDRNIQKWAVKLNMHPYILNGDLHWWYFRISAGVLALWIAMEIFFPHWVTPVKMDLTLPEMR